MFTQSFKTDLDALINKIQSKEPFALARYADGEYATLHNEHITGCDGWSITEADKPLAIALEESLQHTEDNYFYGISCPCCDPPKHEYFKNRLGLNKRITFSNLMVNANWNKAFEFLKTYEDKILLANWTYKIPNSIGIPSDLIKVYREQPGQIEEFFKAYARMFQSKLICIGGGPVAKVAIHWMYQANPNNQYLDVGSALDPLGINKQTRSYHTSNSGFNTRVCHM